MDQKFYLSEKNVLALISGSDTELKELNAGPVTAEPISLRENILGFRTDTGEMTMAEVAYGFVMSKEFGAGNMENGALVDAVYQAMLGRKASAEEKAAWVAALAKGEPVYTVINGICATEEFSEICLQAGIKAGKVKPGLVSGDANGDGKLDGKDSILLMKYLAGEINPDTGKVYEIDEKAADLNSDGKVDELDLLRLMKLLASA